MVVAWALQAPERRQGREKAGLDSIEVSGRVADGCWFHLGSFVHFRMNRNIRSQTAIVLRAKLYPCL